MNILIFGGGGFIGSAIVDRLLLDGHELTVFERPRVESFRPFNNTEKVTWVTGDILSQNDISNAMQNIELVIHLVSTTLPKSSNEDPIYDVQSNLVGTLQILNTMCNMGIKRIVFISSGGTVYGPPEYTPIDEKHQCRPQVSYGITKQAIENYLLLYKKTHSIQPIILRVSNPYGKRQRVETAQGAASVFINRAVRQMPIEIWGDGSITRDFIYIDDVAEAFSLAVNYSGIYDIFNISSGVGTSLNELMVEIESTLNCKVDKHYKAARMCDVPVSVLSNQLAYQELGWQPKVSLRMGIEYTAKWMRQQLS